MFDLRPVTIGAGIGRTRRPLQEECELYVFPAHTGSPGSGMRSVDTVVIIGPCGDVCVYHGERLSYSVVRPNRRFFLDVASFNLRAGDHAGIYVGDDVDEVQSLPAHVELCLAGLAAAAGHCPGQALAAAEMLDELSARLRAGAAYGLAGVTGHLVDVRGEAALPR